jgi:hypothetical protein
MAFSDNIIYRLKPNFGDTTAHNELNNSDILTGGTLSIVTGDSGLANWRNSGADSIATGISKAITVANASGGFTIAIRLKIVTAPSGGTGFVPFVQMYKNGDANTNFGLTQSGTGNIRARYASSGIANIPIGAFGTAMTTYILRISTNGSGNEVLDVWKEKVGRLNTDPDWTANNATLNTTLDRLLVGGQNSLVQDIEDIVIWSDQKPNSECAPGADNLRGLLDAPAAVTGTISWTEAADTVAATGEVEISGVIGTIAWTEAADTVSVTGNVASDVATITTDPFANWVDEAAITSETIPNVMVVALDRTVVLSLADQVTDASTGRLAISDAALEFGEWYIVACFNEDGTIRGIDRYQAQ